MKKRGIQWIIALLLCLLAMSGCGRAVDAEPYLVERAVYTFSDGQSVSLWRSPGDGKDLYQLEDGTQLLAIREELPIESLLSMDDSLSQKLSAEAREQIAGYYSAQTWGGDLAAYLEAAYAAYAAESDQGFSCYLRERELAFSGSNDTLVYFTTTFYLPMDAETYITYSLTRAFDAATGARISGWELFSAAQEQVKVVLLRSSGAEPSMEEALLEAFQPEFVRLYSDRYEIACPLTGESGTQVVALGGAYTEDVRGILNAWAIPD